MTDRADEFRRLADRVEAGEQKYWRDPRLPDRFWEKIKVDLHTGCWLWTAHINLKGYAQFFWGKQKRAHRVAYEELIREIPEELVCDHICETRHCVNPNHMQIISSQENIRKSPKWEGRKTHCPYGHPYAGDNLKIDKRGHRECRACRRKRNRENWRKAHARLALALRVWAENMEDENAGT